jgi:hypothetical protein
MRLQRESGHGQSIALALVTLVAVPIRYCVNGRYDDLANPDTDELIEIDIFLPDYNFAIEFHGEQHFHPTSFASVEDVSKQQKRDVTKASLLKTKRKALVVLTTADLSVAAVTKKLQGLIPLRNLDLYRRLVDYLNGVGEAYQRAAQRLAGPAT